MPSLKPVPPGFGRSARPARFKPAPNSAPEVSMETTREHPWSNADLSPDERARLAEAAMNDDERFALVHGIMAVPFPGLAARSLPNAAVPGAGYVAGAPRLGIPSLRETDATLGV